MMSGHFKPHDPWLSEDDQRFLLALGFSALAHFVLIVTLKSPPPDWQAHGQAALSVSFRAASSESRPIQQPRQATPEALAERPAILVQKQATIAIPHTMEKAAGGVPAPVPLSQKEPGVPARPQALPRGAAAPGTDAPPRPQTGWVNALLSIGDGGEVREIIWRELPALTDDQLHRLEAHIRGRNYGSTMAGRTVNETVDVRPFIAGLSIRTPTPVGDAPAQ